MLLLPFNPSSLSSPTHPPSPTQPNYLGDLNKGVVEEERVRLLKALDDKEPSVLPATGAL